jgi:hypothetical protein
MKVNLFYTKNALIKLDRLINYTVFYLMLQQKIVIKVQMSSEKYRIKAMKIAATTDGILPIKLNIIYIYIYIYIYIDFKK